MRLKAHAHHPRSIRRQGGFLIITASLALVIMSILALQMWQDQQRRDDNAQAQAQADVLKSVRNAAETLMFEHYTSYQAGQPVTKNGVTLPFGTSPGESMSPTVAQLATMGLGIDGMSDRGSYKSLTDAGYILRLERVPAGCEASPQGRECNLTGLVCYDRALRDPARPAGDVDGEAIGRMMLGLGGDGGASLLGVASGRIVGSMGDWEAANPVAGAPAGIVCSRFGFGSSGFANFLRVRDTRDPEFQNNVTIAGGINVQQTATLGASCAGTAEGMAVWGEVNGNPVWLRCDAGVWTPGNGITYAVAGDTCTVAGQFAMTTAGIALVCSNGRWVSQESKGLRTAAYYIHGSTVPTPACGPGLTPSAVIAAVSASNIIGINNTGNNTGSFQASINPSWRVSVTGSDGAAAGNSATALILTFCNPT